MLRRAIKTLWCVLEETDLMWIPVEKSWRLNERHYGALQGLNKAETAAEYGDEQVKIWRRSYATRPPLLTKDDERWPGHESRYASLSPAELPLGECLEDTVARVVPYWREVIAPEVRAGRRQIIAAHGNSLRALVKYLDDVSEKDILELNIPTGVPLVYELDEEAQADQALLPRRRGGDRRRAGRRGKAGLGEKITARTDIDLYGQGGAYTAPPLVLLRIDGIAAIFTQYSLPLLFSFPGGERY